MLLSLDGSPVGRLCAAVIVVLTASVASASTVRHDGAYLSTSPFDSVGRFTGSTPSYGFSASGVLIGSDWVLTAAHVVENATSLNFQLGGSSHSVDVVNDVYIHSAWDSANLTGDLALVQLNTAVTGVTTARINTKGNEVGKTATFAGYGYGGDGLTGYDTGSSLVLRAVENTIDLATSDGVLLGDFDSPTGTDNVWGSAQALSSEGLIAPGDSGGGMFIRDRKGNYSLAGINSFLGATDGDVDGDYGDIFGVTRVSFFDDWIAAITGVSGGKGKPGGGGGGAGKPGRGGGRPASQLLLTTPVPEPSTLGLLGLGAAVLIRRRAR